MTAPSQQQQLDQLEHNLTNHAPKNDAIIGLFVDIRTKAKNLGAEIIFSTPQSREQSLALTNLEQAVMWAVAAIARNQDEIETEET